MDLSWVGLVGGPATAAHIHCCAPPGTNAGVLFPFAGVPNTTSGSIPEQTFAITRFRSTELEAGEIRGQILATPEPASLALLAFGLLFATLYVAKARRLNA